MVDWRLRQAAASSRRNDTTTDGVALIGYPVFLLMEGQAGVMG